MLTAILAGEISNECLRPEGADRTGLVVFQPRSNPRKEADATETKWYNLIHSFGLGDGCFSRGTRASKVAG